MSEVKSIGSKLQKNQTGDRLYVCKFIDSSHKYANVGLFIELFYKRSLSDLEIETVDKYLDSIINAELLDKCSLSDIEDTIVSLIFHATKDDTLWPESVKVDTLSITGTLCF